MASQDGGARSPIDFAIGQRIKQQRRKLGLTQRVLADVLKVRPGQISYYENGLQRLPAAALYELSLVLKVSVEWFFVDISPPEAPKPALDAEARAVAMYQLGQLLGKLEDPKDRALLKSLLQQLPLGGGASEQNDDEDR